MSMAADIPMKTPRIFTAFHLGHKPVLAGIALLFTLVILSPATYAGTTWDGGGGSGNWSEANNWNSNTLPGSGTLTLSAGNTYTGSTTINAGTLSIATITNGAVAGALGNLTNGAGNLVLGGGTLQYTGSNGSTDRNFTLTAEISYRPLIKNWLRV